MVALVTSSNLPVFTVSAGSLSSSRRRWSGLENAFYCIKVKPQSHMLAKGFAGWLKGMCVLALQRINFWPAWPLLLITELWYCMDLNALVSRPLRGE